MDDLSQMPQEIVIMAHELSLSKMKRCFFTLFFIMVVSTSVIFIWTIYFITVRSFKEKEILPTPISVKLAGDGGSTKVTCSYAPRPSEEHGKGNKSKLILFYDFPDYYNLKSVIGSAAFKSCNQKCNLTINSSHYNQADAVVFYSQKVNKHLPEKIRGQIWIFFAVECPIYSDNNIFADPIYEGKFNYTMTYRYDSDFVQAYLQIVKKPKPLSYKERVKSLKHYKEVFANKTKMVAWFVSHCPTHSKRLDYVRELSKYIQVDIYGKCGTMKCGSPKQCQRMLSKDYKFYLSFENALCVDYVTEKLLKILDLHTIVPVVRGGADYNKIFPHNSLVNTRDFPSPASLAAHLKELAEDEDAFASKLQWAWDFDTRGPFLPMCNLCERLHIPAPVSCFYDDIYAWWAQNACVYPNDLGFSRTPSS